MTEFVRTFIRFKAERGGNCTKLMRREFILFVNLDRTNIENGKIQIIVGKAGQRKALYPYL